HCLLNMFCRYPVHISKCVIHPCKETCTKLCENIFLSTWMFLLHGETHRAIFANCSIFNLCLCVDKRWLEMKFTSIVGWDTFIPKHVHHATSFPWSLSHRYISYNGAVLCNCFPHPFHSFSSRNTNIYDIRFF